MLSPTSRVAARPACGRAGRRGLRSGTADLHEVLDSVTGLLAADYHVTHATIQCEPADHQDHASPI